MNYIVESLNQGVRKINFHDYEHFNDVDILITCPGDEQK